VYTGYIKRKEGFESKGYNQTRFDLLKNLISKEYTEIHSEVFNMSTQTRRMRGKIDGTGMYVVRVESLDDKDVAPWSCAVMCEGIFKTTRESCVGSQTFEPFIIYSDLIKSEVVLEVRRDTSGLFNMNSSKRKRAKRGDWKFSIIKIISSDCIVILGMKYSQIV
jgi:hypothetical protein